MKVYVKKEHTTHQHKFLDISFCFILCGCSVTVLGFHPQGSLALGENVKRDDAIASL